MLQLKQELGRWPQQKEVAERAGISKANLSHALKALEKRGLVTPTVLLPNEVTSEGRKLLRKASK